MGREITTAKMYSSAMTAARTARGRGGLCGAPLCGAPLCAELPAGRGGSIGPAGPDLGPGPQPAPPVPRARREAGLPEPAGLAAHRATGPVGVTVVVIRPARRFPSTSLQARVCRGRSRGLGRLGAGRPGRPGGRARSSCGRAEPAANPAPEGCGPGAPAPGEGGQAVRGRLPVQAGPGQGQQSKYLSWLPGGRGARGAGARALPGPSLATSRPSPARPRPAPTAS